MAYESEHRDDNYLDRLKEKYEGCSKCEAMVPYRKSMVWGSGPHDAMIAVVGEAPGGSEETEGVPFVGPAGQTFNNLLEEVGIPREDLYITNSVLCRSTMPGQGGKRKNRNPTAAEIANCRERLVSELLYVDPLIILALGRLSATALYGRQTKLESVRGRIADIKIITNKEIEVSYPVLPTYHPSYLMTYSKDNDLFLALRDLRMLKDIVKTYLETKGKK